MTRRDLVVALAAVIVTLGVNALVRADAPVLHSSTFDWASMSAEPTKVGAVRRVVQAPTPTLDELEIHITTLNPGEAPHPPHMHPDEELIIVKEGTVEALNHGANVRLGPGSVIPQASNELHGIKNVGEGQATYHVIRWNSPGMLKKKPVGR
jgi:XRE family transcriptional regulator, regulator of sulfur utilization